LNKSPQHQIFRIISPVGAGLIHQDELTEGTTDVTKLKNRFSRLTLARPRTTNSFRWIIYWKS